MSARNPMPALLALALGYFTFGTSSLAVVGLGVPMSAGLAVEPATIGLLVTVFALTFAVAAPIAPAALSGLNRKQALLIGLALMALGGVLSAVATSYWMLVVARVVGALGAGAYAPGASAAGSLIVPEERRARALATVFGGMTAAAVLGVPLSSFLGAAVGWRWALGGVAALTVLALVMVAVVLPAVEQGERPSARAYRQVLATPGAVPTVLTTLLFMASQFTVYGVAGAYIAGRSGASAGVVSLVLLTFGVLGVVGNTVGAPVYERIGGARTIAIALGGLAIAFAALAVVPGSVVAVLVLFAFWAFFSQMYQAPQQARLVALLPEQRAIILALNASTMYVGVSLGSFLGGVLLPALGARPLTLIGLLPLAVGGIAHLFSTRRLAPVYPAAAVTAS